MFKRALITVAVLAVATPGLALAKGKKAADTSGAAEANAGPVPYSQLASEDAKLSGPAPKHHSARKKASKAASGADSGAGSQGGGADAGKSAQ